MTAPAIVLVVPVGRDRRAKVKLPHDVAARLHRQLGDALALPNAHPKRPVRLRRGRWVGTSETQEARR